MYAGGDVVQLCVDLHEHMLDRDSFQAEFNPLTFDTFQEVEFVQSQILTF